MRKLIILLISISLFSCNKDEILPDKIFEGDLTLSTQKSVDIFGSDNYTEIIGTLHIGGTFLNRSASIRNIDKLASLKAITHLEIECNDSLINIDGLKNLSLVENINIEYNPSLVNIGGLRSLPSVYNGSLTLTYNLSLEDLKGLSHVEFIKDLFIIDSPINNLEGLNKLNTANYIYIHANSNLTNLRALSNLIEVNSLHIAFNDSLKSLEGLNKLSAIGDGGFWLRGNNSLISINGLEKLLQNEGNLSIFENYKLENLDGISNLNFVGGNLTVALNYLPLYDTGLNDLCGLQSLLSNEGIAGRLSIKENLYNPSQQDIIDGNCSQ